MKHKLKLLAPLLALGVARVEQVLTDFGCEHSFARAAGSVLEHYGLAIGVSAVRDATLEHADQIAHLRVLRANQQWESLWN